jgi:hypothetical protein
MHAMQLLAFCFGQGIWMQAGRVVVLGFDVPDSCW